MLQGPMLVALDAHAIGRHLTGNEVYARNLLAGLAAIRDDAEFIAYVSTAVARGQGWGRCRLRAVSSNAFVRLGCGLSRRLRRDRPDLLHVQYTAPLACPVPVVASVHDVSFLEHPEYFTRLRRTQLRWSVRRTVHAAARVLTGSAFARASILRAYPALDPDRVVVVPHAAAAAFRPLPRDSATASVRERFNISAPFVLTVGDLQPRKNHIGLITAFSRLLRAFPQLPHDLVLAGKETWYSEHIHAAADQSGFRGRIRFAGFVDDGDLLHLYNACDLFVFPSFYEGFGLPLLEAMACGRAVACSDTSAFAEVTGGAAVLFDPYLPDEIARAMADLLVHPDLRARFEKLGTKRAAAFSWKRTAARTLALYYEVAEQGVRARGRVPSASISRS